MKKYIKSIILTAVGASLLTSCQTELDTFNENPNNPTTTTPTLLLSAMEVSTFSTHTSGLIRTSNIFDQHLAGTSVGQLGDIQRYILSEQDVNNEWNTVYGTTLISGHILSRDFADKFPYYNGIGQVLTALNLGYATDVWEMFLTMKLLELKKETELQNTIHSKKSINDYKQFLMKLL